jgi:hypothetical protein
MRFSEKAHAFSMSMGFLGSYGTRIAGISQTKIFTWSVFFFFLGKSGGARFSPLILKYHRLTVWGRCAKLSSTDEGVLRYPLLQITLSKSLI